MDKDFKEMIFVIIISLLIGLLVWVGRSYVKMKSFNKFSVKKVTLIDAMFLDLRVITDGGNKCL